MKQLLPAILCSASLMGCSHQQLRPIEHQVGNDFVASYSRAFDGFYYGRADLKLTYYQVKFVNLHNEMPEVVDLTGPAGYRLFSAPNVIQSNGQEYIYYVASEQFWGNHAQLMRIPSRQSAKAESVFLPAKYGAHSLLRIINLSNQHVALTFRAGKSELFFARAKDGLHFSKPVAVARGTMPAIAQFADGTILLSYQNGLSINAMKGRIQISQDFGDSWSMAKTLPHDGNIHDLYPAQRADGNIDLYYSVEDVPKRMALYRICINAQMQFGTRERLLSANQVNAAKSAMFTTQQGRMLTFSDQNSDLSKANLTLYPLHNDSPSCPIRP